MTDFRQELLAAFDAEHKEHLRTIRHALEAAGTEAPFDLKDVFRRAHSLKGAARAVDLPVVVELADRLETLFARILEQETRFDRTTIDAVQLGLDAIEGYVAALATTPDPEPPVESLHALDRLLGVDVQTETEIGARPAPAFAAEQAATPIEYLRIGAGQVDNLTSAMHALSGELQFHDGLLEGLTRLESDVRSLNRDWDRLRQSTGPLSPRRDSGQDAGPESAAARRQNPSLRDFDRDIKNLQRGLAAFVRAQRGAEWKLEHAAGTLREHVEQISLLPAETVLGPLGRMVRDLVRAEGRDVNLRFAGLDLQVDRRVLQRLKDPLMHLLRNAVSHGVESEQARMARGKPPVAEIGLTVSARGGRLLLTVYDDGGGPDLAGIEATAVRRGLLPPREPGAPPLPQDQLLTLVFEPGFSTASEVGPLSGRGMGLSVVAEAARDLRGSAQLRPRLPWGTEVLISVPFSVGRQPLLLVDVQGQICCLPTYGVERLLRLRADALESAEGGTVARITVGERDVVVPVVALAALTGGRTEEIPVEAEYVNAVLLRRGSGYCAAAVTAFHDVRTLLVGDADTVALGGNLVAGIALLEGDRPAVVFNPEELVERWTRDQRHLAATGSGLAKPAAVRRTATILVVDDSITTRTLEKSILESQGYRVLLSVDGLDALAQLRAADEVIDLVVADIEMPRMDGFALLQAIKNDARFTSLPVILMTSRGSPEDIRRGLELGAAAYISKQKFDQGELLGMIGQIL